MPASLFQGPELQPGFMVIHGNRLEALRDLAVVWLLRAHPLGPLEDEVVLLQSASFSQWLKLALDARYESISEIDREQSAQSALPTLNDRFSPFYFHWSIYSKCLEDEPSG